MNARGDGDVPDIAFALTVPTNSTEHEPNLARPNEMEQPVRRPATTALEPQVVPLTASVPVIVPSGCSTQSVRHVPDMPEAFSHGPNHEPDTLPHDDGGDDDAPRLG